MEYHIELQHRVFLQIYISRVNFLAVVEPCSRGNISRSHLCLRPHQARRWCESLMRRLCSEYQRLDR